jgi:hypothetical protein
MAIPTIEYSGDRILILLIGGRGRLVNACKYVLDFAHSPRPTIVHIPFSRVHGLKGCY